MLASLLYHTNQIEDVQVKNCEFGADRITFHVDFIPKGVHCPLCFGKGHAEKGRKIRKLQMAPMGSKQAFLEVQISRLKCSHCDHVYWPILPFAQSKKRVTISFEKFVLRLMQFATISHVASFLKVSWGLIKNIHKTHLLREYEGVDFQPLRYIGVDEFSIHKGHEYMTIFINLESGEIIHAVEGKSISSVTPFLMQLKENAINLKAIAMDMNAAYASATRQFLPNVDIVFDRFHVVSLLNQAIDEIRREQMKKCNEVGVKVMKGYRFLLLKNYETLGAKLQGSLAALFEVNRPIAAAHYLKEQIRMFWNKATTKEGAEFLSFWLMDAFETGISELQKAGRTLLRHSKDLLNFFKHRITNGKTEGINNKIKTMKRQAYGFRDMIYFKLRLYNLHKVRYSFV
jgi:transposase